MKSLQEIMSRNTQVVRPDSPVIEAARHMKRFSTGVIPVCEGDRIQGMLTDRDIVVRGVAEDRSLESLKVAEVMSPGAHWLYQDQSLDDAAALMKKERVQRIIVVDRKKKLVGWISLADLAVAGEEEDLHDENLQETSPPSSQLSAQLLGSAPSKALVLKSLAFVLLGGLVGAVGYGIAQKKGDLKAFDDGELGQSSGRKVGEILRET